MTLVKASNTFCENARTQKVEIVEKQNMLTKQKEVAVKVMFRTPNKAD